MQGAVLFKKVLRSVRMPCHGDGVLYGKSSTNSKYFIFLAEFFTAILSNNMN